MNSERTLTVIGIAGLILGVVMSIARIGFPFYILGAELLCVLSFMAASGIHHYAAIKRFLGSRLGTRLFWIFHAVILVFSAAAARVAVNHALGMPAADYTSTVSICALIYYIPTWMTGIGFLAVIAAFICFTVIPLAALFLKVASIARDVSPIVCGIAWMPKLESTFDSYAKQAKGFAIRRARDFIVLFVFGVFLVCPVGWLNSKLLTNPVIIKSIAYRFDYKQMAHYPGIDPNSRVVIHNPHLYTEATPKDGDIVITPKPIPEETK